MPLRLSSGFAHATQVTGSTLATMANGTIHIYSGTQPADANDTEAGTLLMKITLNSGAFTGTPSTTNGINMETDVAGVLSKAVAEVWSGVGLAAAGTGTEATWFRWYSNAYETGAGTSKVRVDGGIGTTTAYQMRMSNTTIVENGPSVVTAFTFTRPRV